MLTSTACDNLEVTGQAFLHAEEQGDETPDFTENDDLIFLFGVAQDLILQLFLICRSKSLVQ